MKTFGFPDIYYLKPDGLTLEPSGIIADSLSTVILDHVSDGFTDNVVKKIKAYDAEPHPRYRFYVWEKDPDTQKPTQIYYRLSATALTHYHTIPMHHDKTLGLEISINNNVCIPIIQTINGIERLSNLYKNILSICNSYIENKDYELAYQTSHGYLTIQTTENDTIDYTLYDENRQELDGGIIDDNITIYDAITDILTDEHIPLNSLKVINYDDFVDSLDA